MIQERNFELLQFTRCGRVFVADESRCVVDAINADLTRLEEEAVVAQRLTNGCFEISTKEYLKNPESYGRAVYVFCPARSKRDEGVAIHPSRIVVKKRKGTIHTDYTLAEDEDLKSLCIDNKYQWEEVNFHVLFPL